MEVVNSKGMIEGSRKAISFMVVNSESNLLKTSAFDSGFTLSRGASRTKGRAIAGWRAGRCSFSFFLSLGKRKISWNEEEDSNSHADVSSLPGFL